MKPLIFHLNQRLFAVYHNRGRSESLILAAEPDDPLIGLFSFSLAPGNRIYLLGCVAMALNPILIKRCYRGSPSST